MNIQNVFLPSLVSTQNDCKVANLLDPQYAHPFLFGGELPTNVTAAGCKGRSLIFRATAHHLKRSIGTYPTV